MEISYDVGRFQEACQQVRDVRKEVESTYGGKLREDILDLLRRATRGMYSACKEIYEPTIDSSQVKRAGSESDLETDKKGLALLAELDF